MEPLSKIDLILAGVQKFMRRGATHHLSNMINKLHPADVGKVVAQLSTVGEKKELLGLMLDLRVKASVMK